MRPYHCHPFTITAWQCGWLRRLRRISFDRLKDRKEEGEHGSGYIDPQLLYRSFPLTGVVEPRRPWLQEHPDFGQEENMSIAWNNTHQAGDTVDSDIKKQVAAHIDLILGVFLLSVLGLVCLRSFLHG